MRYYNKSLFVVLFCILHSAFCILHSAFYTGCAYRIFPGPLTPLPETGQSSDMRVADDGTVTFVKDRLEISLRPMTDEELNRLFPAESSGGEDSINPYTYGNWKPRGAKRTPQRFTIFRLQVKNYAYPKVFVDPRKMLLTASNGDKYLPLTLGAMKEQYYPFAIAYAGNTYSRFDAMVDIVRKTLYEAGTVFSGQENDGYVVFPVLGDNVRQIDVHLNDIVLRFDFQGIPVEMTKAAFRFQREVHRE